MSAPCQCAGCRIAAIVAEAEATDGPEAIATTLTTILSRVGSRVSPTLIGVLANSVVLSASLLRIATKVQEAAAETADDINIHTKPAGTA